MNKYAKIIVDLKVRTIDKPFTYAIPDDMRDKLGVGSLVSVPFGGRKHKGYCIGFTDEAVEGVKPVYAVTEEDYCLSTESIKLASWMCSYYNCLWSEALNTILPAVVRNYFQKTREMYFVKYNDVGACHGMPLRKNSKKYLILQHLRECGDWAAVEELKEKFGVNFSFLKPLVEAKYIELQTRKIGIYDNAEDRGQKTEDRNNAVGATLAVAHSHNENLTLTKDQEESLEILKKLLASGKQNTFLLHGVTASGKTEIYMRLISECLRAGNEAIVLVPEISLTPQNIKLFKERFGDSVAVLHSALDNKERLSEWIKIAAGEARIALGARSAVFAPFNNIGLIIVDEEHETSYKQENAPRYNARNVAFQRMLFNKGLLVLGSATPSVESFYKAKNGVYGYYHLPVRVLGKTLPDIVTVDLKEKKQKAPQIFGELLKNEISYSLLNNEQVIIFLNRRGFNTFILCRECGYIYKCKNCNVSLIYHKEDNRLICHHCFFTSGAPSSCAQCGSSKFKYGGLGIQKAEEELQQLYPAAKILRMDADTTRKKGSHEAILTDFSSRRADILIGTQMITKGLDFPSVNLVGVVLADTGLNIPDFRASERTFQLLTQVAGRSGRGDKQGKVIIQTYEPDNFSITSVIAQDYFKFYGKEIVNRQEALYPPFCEIINCVISSTSQQDVTVLIEKFSSSLREKIKNLKSAGKDFLFEILGPAPCPITRIQNRYRWHTVIKCDDIIGANEIINEVISKFKIQKDVRFILDADPVSLL